MVKAKKNFFGIESAELKYGIYEEVTINRLLDRLSPDIQKKLEEAKRFSLDEILKLKKFSDEEIVPRDKLTELWFEVDYEINFQRINSESDIDRLRKLSLFLGDINKRMTNFSNPVSLYFEHLVKQKLGVRETKTLLDRARKVVDCSSLWSQRINYLKLEELI